MAETMSPSKVTAVTTGQIGKLQEMFGAGLRKAKPELPSNDVQQAMEKQGDAMVSDLVNVVRKRAEMFANMIVRRVRVNRSRKPQEAIDATGRVKHLNQEVVAEMPQCEGEEVEVCFFPLRRCTSAADVQKLLEKHGLTPDPYAVCAVNEADPSFADNYPNATQWVDGNGRHCYAAFSRWGDERYVGVDRSKEDWRVSWWFGGVRK